MKIKPKQHKEKTKQTKCHVYKENCQTPMEKCNYEKMKTKTSWNMNENLMARKMSKLVDNLAK